MGQARHLYKIFHENNQTYYLSASRMKDWNGKPELQIIISYNKLEEGVQTYRIRSQIEAMFRAMKTAGFNIEDTHLSDLSRIEKLLLLVILAFVWCYNIGASLKFFNSRTSALGFEPLFERLALPRQLVV